MLQVANIGRADKIASIHLQNHLHKHTHTVIFQPGPRTRMAKTSTSESPRYIRSKDVPAEMVCWTLEYLWKDPSVNRNPER